MADKVRLGGMALPNGVLVHGPTAWACAIRREDGTLAVAAERKRFRADERTPPLLRGPMKLLEAVAGLPSMRKALPDARLPFERRSVLATMLASAAAVRAVRGSSLGAPTQELAAAVLSFAPAIFALRGSDLAGYHGAEHVSIGTYEHDEPRAKEHERCGSHLVGPIVVTTAVAQALAAKAPAAARPLARAFATLGALGVSTEIFAWMVKNPKHPVAQALSRPGHEIQHRVGTDEPSPEQLEVADAALRACLELEEGAAGA
jgi:uncharacterized protein YqhQ